MNRLAKSLLIRYRVQRSVLAVQAAACVAATCYWAALVDDVNAGATAGLAFAVTLAAAWSIAKPFGDVAAHIERSSDPQAIARTCLSQRVGGDLLEKLSEGGSKLKIKFKSVPQLSGVVVACLCLAAALQWQVYSPQHLSVAQQALLAADLSSISTDGKPLSTRPVTENKEMRPTAEKIANQLAADARQYPRLDSQHPSSNIIVGGAAFGDEVFVLQRYQKLKNK
jgi:hypothetical protein